MPTSSQALILQTTNGHLPPVFGRQNKRSILPSGLEWTNIEHEVYPLSNMHILTDEQPQTRTRKHEKQQVRPPVRKRTESAPALTYKFNSENLPKLLSVRGIHGSLRVDQNTNSIRWKINSIGPFYEKRGESRLYLPRLNREPPKFQYFHADQMNSYRWDEMHYANAMTEPRTYLSPKKAGYYHSAGRSIPSQAINYYFNSNGGNKMQSGGDVAILDNGTGRWHHDFDSKAFRQEPEQAEYYNIFKRTVPFEQAFMHRTKTENSYREDMINDNENPEANYNCQIRDQYFRLVPARSNGVYDTKDTLYATFELEKCSVSETGAFRLLPTLPGEYGDFKLKPSAGIASDRFRIYSTMSNPDRYILLESDGNSGDYRPLFLNHDCEYSYQESQAGTDDKQRTRHIPDIVIPREAWVHQSDKKPNDGYVAGQANVRLTDKKERLKQSNMHENKYDNFNDITAEISAKDADHFDVNVMNSNDTWNKYHDHKQIASSDKKYGLERGPNEENNTVGEMVVRENGHFTKGNESQCKQHKEIFKERDNTAKQSIDDQSRNSLNYHENKNQVLNSNWNVSDFDQWSRTTSKDISTEQSKIGVLNSDKQINTKEQKDQINKLKTDTDAILSAVKYVKYKASYKLWKKRRISTIRMRKVLPPSDPNAVCMKVDDGTISHDKMKHNIESEIGCKLISLQFDPVLADSFQGESKYRWILRFANSTVCDALVLRGIHVNGIKRSVRRYDDVMKEEHDVYYFYQMMKGRDKMATQKDTKKILPKLNEMSTTTEAQTTT
ncbi:hypothetical protein ACF0H5_008248 [Mactra antiquata]